MTSAVRRPTRPALGSASVCALIVCAASASLAADVQSGQAAQPVRSGAAPQGLTCTGLKGLQVAGVLIDGADMLASGEAAGSSFTGPIKAPVDLCRVRAVASPEPTSRIRMEIWLPMKWNGKLVGNGGGGLNGGLGSSLGDLATGAASGYAGVITDAGHDINGGTQWGLDPARVADYGYRANHLAALAGKAVIESFYGRPASRSYFRGCSNGGRDALMLAQRFPADYDGIVAGAPAADWAGLLSAGMWNSQRVNRIPEAATFPAKLKLLRAAVSRKCDMLDGVADGVIDNPPACKFDPMELQCTAGADPATCLSSADVRIAREIYRGPRLADGKQIFAGLPVGSEYDAANPGLGWGPFITADGIGAKLLGTEYFRWIVYRDPQWQAKSFSLDRDYAAALSRTGSALNATDPDLREFVGRGGKLIIYHGWEDAAIPAGATLDYFAAMRGRTGASADRNVRLFMMPGVAHCVGGPGASMFDKLELIDRWVQGGAAPGQIVAHKYENDMQVLNGVPSKLVSSRLVCAWPRIARYQGTGSTDDPANFRCERSRSQK